MPNSTTSRTASTTPAGPAESPQPGQEQQPGADRPVEPRQQHVGPPARRQPRHPAVGNDVGVALDAMAATLPAAMSGSIRLFVTAAARPRRRDRRDRRPGSLPRHGDAPRGRRRRRAVQRARRRVGRADRRTWPRRRAASPSTRRLRPQAAEPDLWLVFAPAQARCDRSGGAEGHRARRRSAAAGSHRADQRRAGQPGPVSRHCHRSGRTERAPDRPRHPRTASAGGRCCIPGPPTAACLSRPSAPPRRRSAATPARPRCWSAPRAASHRRSLTRCGSIPLLRP